MSGKVTSQLVVSHGRDVNGNELPILTDAIGRPYVLLSEPISVSIYTDNIDAATNSVNTVDYAHHEIHSGSHFNIADYDTSVALNDTLEFVVTTPNTTKWIHMIFQFSSTQGATLDVYEGSSSIVGGTPVIPVNNNRNSITASVLTVLREPTSLTDGTKIEGHMAGAGRTSGFYNRDMEIILKQNTSYLFRFTSLANSNAWSYVAEWYEHTNKV